MGDDVYLCGPCIERGRRTEVTAGRGFTLFRGVDPARPNTGLCPEHPDGYTEAEWQALKDGVCVNDGNPAAPRACILCSECVARIEDPGIRRLNGGDRGRG